MKTFNKIVLLSLLVISYACHTTHKLIPQSQPLSKAPKHVIIIGFDGLSSYSIMQNAKMPTLRSLMEKGAYTLKNRSVLPSSSAVNWASMWMGASPELHGYTKWDSREPALQSRSITENGRFPDIFHAVRKAKPNAEIGYLYEWRGMKYLADTLSINYVHRSLVSGENTKEATQEAINYIQTKKPDLCAIIFNQPDGIGHKKGWESEEYMNQLIHLDNALAHLIEGIENAGIMDDTVIIVVSDHGGKKTKHGGISMNEMETPIVFYGKGIKKGFEIPESTMIYDITGTVGYMLHIEQPQVWLARPILSIFE